MITSFYLTYFIAKLLFFISYCYKEYLEIIEVVKETVKLLMGIFYDFYRKNF